MASAVSGKSKVRTMQCCNYSRGSCHVSHSITMPKIESAFISGLKQAVENKSFVIKPKTEKKSGTPEIDYNKLIALEVRRLERAREAYLAEIDSIEQYAKNKKEITERIEDLKNRQNREVIQNTDVEVFAKKVSGIVEFIERNDVTDTAKNELLHTIIEKVVFEKAKGNLAIYFHDI